MNDLVRKIMMTVSIFFIGAIIYFVLNNILNNFKIDYIAQYKFKIIFVFLIGLFVLAKSFSSKKILMNIELSYLDKIIFIFTSIVVIIVYLTGIYIFIYETFFKYQTGVGCIIGIMIAFLIYNLELNIIKNKTENSIKKESDLLEDQ